MAPAFIDVVAMSVAATRCGPDYLHVIDGLYLVEFKEALSASVNRDHHRKPAQHRYTLMFGRSMGRVRTLPRIPAQKRDCGTESQTSTRVTPCYSNQLAIQPAAGCLRFLAARPQQAQLLDRPQPSDGECRPRSQ